nr:hypothetical protein [Angustibacter aerolatus]
MHAALRGDLSTPGGTRSAAYGLGGADGVAAQARGLLARRTRRPRPVAARGEPDRRRPRPRARRLRHVQDPDHRPVGPRRRPAVERHQGRVRRAGSSPASPSACTGSTTPTSSPSAPSRRSTSPPTTCTTSAARATAASSCCPTARCSPAGPTT